MAEKPSPIVNGGSPILNGGSPTGDGGSGNVNGGAPIADGGFGIQNGGSGILNGGAPIRDGGIGTGNGGSPIRDGGVGIQNGGSGILNGGTPIRDGGIGTGNGGTPIGELTGQLFDAHPVLRDDRHRNAGRHRVHGDAGNRSGPAKFGSPFGETLLPPMRSRGVAESRSRGVAESRSRGARCRAGKLIAREGLPRSSARMRFKALRNGKDKVASAGPAGVIRFLSKKAWREIKEGRFDSALSMRSLRAASSHTVTTAESVRSPRIPCRCHGHGWQRRGATAARGRYHTAPPWRSAPRGHRVRSV